MNKFLSEDLQKSIQRAYNEAKQHRHEFVTLEHLLYALTFDPSACDVLLHTGADISSLGKDLKNFIEKELSSLKIQEKNVKYEPQYTLGVQYILELSVAHKQSSQIKKKISGANILALLFQEKESFAVFFLKKQGLTRLNIVRYISHGVSSAEKNNGFSNETSSDFSSGHSSKPSIETFKGRHPQPNPLSRFCLNLNEAARNKNLDPLIGRKKELDRTIHILARRRKNNPILVGDAGVGKTAIIEGLASQIVSGSIPLALKKREIYSLDMGALLAGTHYRGEFEERIKAVMETVKKEKNPILFIDEIHTIIGAGAVSGGALDASNILKPALANGEISCIGTTTYKEYRSIFEKDHALSRRFQKIEIAEPSQEDAVKILEGLKKYYEDYHGVQYTPNAVRCAVELSTVYIQDRQLPDKAIDILDEAGAKCKLHNENTSVKDPPAVFKVTAKDIEELVSQTAKVPTRTVKMRDKENLKNLGSDLKKFIFGQDEAVEKLVQAIHLSRSGLREENKPIGSFLFAGPTGVGKTELSKQLSKQLGTAFIRFDMSEYIEKHAVSRLIGSPPGYVGFEQGGQLTEAVHRNGRCVLLLDEIEKAHEDLFNILLQVMDYAVLTDNNGRKSNFQNAVLIMTTNVGARESLENAIGFESSYHVNRSLKAVEKTFSPEFRNRLSAVIQFSSLNKKQINCIVQRLIGELSLRLQKKRVFLELTRSAEAYLAEKGFDIRCGARPIQRLIEKEIAYPLSTEVLFGRLNKGGKVKIQADKEKLHFFYE